MQPNELHCPEDRPARAKQQWHRAEVSRDRRSRYATPTAEETALKKANRVKRSTCAVKRNIPCRYRTRPSVGGLPQRDNLASQSHIHGRKACGHLDVEAAHCWDCDCPQASKA